MGISKAQKCPDPSPRLGTFCGFQQPFTLRVHDLDCCEPVEHKASPHETLCLQEYSIPLSEPFTGS